MIKSPEKEKQAGILTDQAPKTSLNKEKAKKISSNLSNQSRNDNSDEKSLPKDFYLYDFGDINPKYLKSPKSEVDPLYEKDSKYDTDSEYKKDSEYVDKSSSDSENEDHGVAAMQLKRSDSVSYLEHFPLRIFVEMPTRISSHGSRSSKITSMSVKIQV